MAKKVLIILLIVVAFFVRMYRFADLTEFLGDQGRDGVIALESYEQKKLPEVGSPLSTGQYTGPIHFYLTVPLFIMSDFNPLVPAIGLCVLEIGAVGLMLILAVSLFGFQIGYSISLLYALSPVLVHQDRILWPPTPVPFFVLSVILSMYLIVERKKYWSVIFLFLANTALIQIHYANGLVVLMSGIFYIWVAAKVIRKKERSQFIGYSLIGLGSSIAITWPFLLYEIRHGFSDVVHALGTFSSAKGLAFSKRTYVENIGTLVTFLSGYIVPIVWKIPLLIFAAFVYIFAIVRRDKWINFFTMWLTVGILVLAYYRDTLQPQYAYALIPLVFLVFGGASRYLSKYISSKPIVVGCIILAIFMTSTLDTFKSGRRDIHRVKSLVDVMIEKSQGEPFSFTLISSPSFSDFHYRFYFMLHDILPAAIDSTSYNRLFLVCESGQCQTPEEIHMNQKIYTVCYEKLCKLNYPIVDIWKWRYAGRSVVESWIIYEYTR